MKRFIALFLIFVVCGVQSIAERPINSRALSGAVEASRYATEIGIAEKDQVNFRLRAKQAYDDAMKRHGPQMELLNREVRKSRNDPDKLEAAQTKLRDEAWQCYQEVRESLGSFLTKAQQRRSLQLAFQAFVFQAKYREAYEVATNKQASKSDRNKIALATSKLTNDRLKIAWRNRSAHLADVIGQRQFNSFAGTVQLWQLPKPVRFDQNFQYNHFSVRYLSQPAVAKALELSASQREKLLALNREVESLSLQSSSESMAIALDNPDKKHRDELHAKKAADVKVQQAKFDRQMDAILGDATQRARQLLFQYFVMAKQPVVAVQQVDEKLLTRDEVTTLEETRVIYDRKEWEETFQQKVTNGRKVLSSLLSAKQLDKAMGEIFEPQAIFGGKRFAAGIVKERQPNPRRKRP